MKKFNLITILFTQLIPARIPKVKQPDGSFIDGKEIPARTIEVSFNEETRKEVNAKNLAQYFLGRLVATQKLRLLQGKEGFQTSKLMTVSIRVNNKNLNSEMKFTINPDRIEKCLERSENLVALIASAASAPKFGAPDVAVKAYLLNTPSQVVIAKARKAEDDVEVPVVEMQEMVLPQ